MLRIIGKDKEGLNSTFAIFDEIKWDRAFRNQGTEWYSKDSDGIQVGQMRYDAGKEFTKHRHKEYPRTANRTQECMIVLKGKLAFTLWDDQNRIIHEGVLEPMQMLITYRGWHVYKSIEDGTIAIETKNGPYTDVSTDKEYK